MNQVAIMSWATEPSEAKLLVESAGRVQAPLVLIGGIGGNDMPLTKPALDMSLRDEPYVVLTDAYDVLMVRWDEAELIGRIEEAGGLLVSTEAGCWPDGPWCSVYGGGRAANGGQYCGRRQQVIAFLETINRRLPEVTAGGGSQETIHRMIADGYPAKLDLNCEIFQSMSGSSSADISMHQGQVFNHATGSMPMFAHWNGRTPGMEEFWKGLNV